MIIAEVKPNTFVTFPNDETAPGRVMTVRKLKGSVEFVDVLFVPEPGAKTGRGVKLNRYTEVEVNA